MVKYQKNEEISNLYSVLRIIFDNTCVILMRVNYDEIFTFEKILEIAKEHGYTIGRLILICESDRTGEIYQTGNHGSDTEVWYKYGYTEGFA